MNDLPQPPEGILDPEKPWHLPMPKSPGLWGTLKARLTGRRNEYGDYSSYVNISEADADRLIANMKKDPRGYPQLDQSTGTPSQWMERQKIYQEWLVEEYLEKPFRKSVDKKIEEAEINRRLQEIEDSKEDQEPEGLDDLLGEIQDEAAFEREQEEEEPDDLDELIKEVVELEQEEPPVEEQVETEINNAIEEEDNTAEKFEEAIDDLPDHIKEALRKKLNRKINPNVQTEEKSKSSSNISNRKILTTIIFNFGRIQSTLDSINENITKQNQLLAANASAHISTSELIHDQNAIISSKFDVIINALQTQNKLQADEVERQEDLDAERKLEQQKDVASTVDYKDLTKGGGDKGEGGSSLLRKIVKFFGRRLGKFLWRKLVPKGIRSRARLARMALSRFRNIPKKIASNVASSLLKKSAPSIIEKATPKVIQQAAPRLAVKGFEHIALPGVTRNLDAAGKTVGEIATSPQAVKAMEGALGPINKAVIKQFSEPKSGMKIALSAFSNPKVQAAISKKIGAEAFQKIAAKLGFKVAGNAIPSGLGQAANILYGVGEAITRTAMGDWKGGLLSLGGAVPFIGAGFSLVDIFRDIDIDAYNKHIEPNLGSIASGDGKPVANFFSEVSGVPVNEYEIGTEKTKPGTAILHGTEAIIKKTNEQNPNTSSMSNIGGSILAATSQYINSAGPVASRITPVFKGITTPLTRQFDVPSVITNTNVGGTLPDIGGVIDRVKEKSGDDELTPDQQKLLETESPQIFVEKLMRIIDPAHILSKLLSGGSSGMEGETEVENIDTEDSNRPKSEGEKLAGELGDYIKEKLKQGPDFQAVTEHPKHGGVGPPGVHAEGSYHYQNRAIDVGAYAHEQSKILKVVEQFNKEKGVKPVEVYHAGNDGGHQDHVHVAYGDGGRVVRPTNAILAEKGKPEYVIGGDPTEIIDKNTPELLDQINSIKSSEDLLNVIKTAVQNNEDKIMPPSANNFISSPPPAVRQFELPEDDYESFGHDLALITPPPSSNVVTPQPRSSAIVDMSMPSINTTGNLLKNILIQRLS